MFFTEVNGEEVAIKLVLIYEEQEEALENEIKAHEALKGSLHCVVASEIYYAQSPNKANPSYVYFVMKKINGGDGFEMANKPFTKLSQKQKISALLGVAKGVLEMHERGITHRDIKPENMLVTEPDPETGLVEGFLADFGGCEYVERVRPGQGYEIGRAHV